MEDLKDMITLIRYKDRIVCYYDPDAFRGRYERFEYPIGEMKNEDIQDIQNSFVGALKYLFNESEVWNE